MSIRDETLLQGIMYVSESRTEDDITTLRIIAELGRYVYELTESVKTLQNIANPDLKSKVDALLPFLPPLTDLTDAINKKVQHMKQEEQTKKRFIKNLGEKFGAK